LNVPNSLLAYFLASSKFAKIRGKIPSRYFGRTKIKPLGVFK